MTHVSWKNCHIMGGVLGEGLGPFFHICCSSNLHGAKTADIQRESIIIIIIIILPAIALPLTEAPIMLYFMRGTWWARPPIWSWVLLAAAWLQWRPRSCCRGCERPTASSPPGHNRPVYTNQHSNPWRDQCCANHSWRVYMRFRKATMGNHWLNN